MILKFRETHIGNMEKERRGGEEEANGVRRHGVNGLVPDRGLTAIVSYMYCKCRHCMTCISRSF